MDKRNRLESDPFTYRSTKDGKLIISRWNKQVKIVSGNKAANFTEMAKNADKSEIQLALAKLTGHFKH